MRTAELIAPHQFRLVDRQIDPPGAGEVQVRVDAVGICGSDLHSYSEGSVGDTPALFPMVLGHEPAGTVVKVGAGVTGWHVGDRAALEPALYCYHCEFCRAGRHNVCANIRFLSTPGHAGFFREFVNLPPTNLFAIPPTMSMELAALVEPLAVAVHSVKLASPRSDETIAVWGAGAIGLLTIASLKVAGVKRIVSIDPLPHRRELAVHLGADVALDPAAVDVNKQIAADTGGRGVDLAMDCAAKEDTVNQAIRAVRNAGRVVLTGIHSGALVPFDTSHMRRKEVTLFNVRRSNDESPEALAMLTERPEWFAPIVTHRRSLENISEAFEIAESYRDGVGKMMVTHSS
ncbi:MAG: alcohol dehydrogenase catalytic domain-containing protein [Ignavibacteriota bacterium]